ncbi:NADH-quinone oxidoreductase subunit M, partial [Paenibacillus sp. TAF58]
MLASLPILSMIAFSPLLGVLVLLFIRGDQGRLIKTIGIVTTLIPLILAAWLYSDYNYQGDPIQYKEQLDWIKVPLNHEGIQQITSYFFEFKYSLAVDGISLPLVFLTALVSSMAALASVYIKKRWKTYFILFLL